jgi:sulfur carrier protein ThiS
MGMIVNVKLLPHEKDFTEVELSHGSTGQQLFEKLNLAFDAHIITRQGDPIPIDEELFEHDKIGILRVVSGG